ncbi:hypothetical protein [Planococcus antarcticus]|nr:hypothetical protein [Planococcus antarcticus]
MDNAIKFIQFAKKKIPEDNWSPDAVSGFTGQKELSATPKFA